jgi:hypothetical protein
MKASLAWAVVVVTGMSSLSCGPESNDGSGTGGTGGTTGGNGGTGGTTAGNGGSMAGAAGGSAGSGPGAGSGGGGGASGAAGSGQSGSGGTAGSGGVARPYGVVQYGTLQHYPSPGRSFQLATAAFYRERAVTTGPVCQRTGMGACFVTDCRVMTDPPEPEPPLPEPLPAPTAGVITMRSTGDFTADLTPDGKSVYVASGAMGSLLGEESVTVTAAGGEVPGFTHTMTYPLLMLLTQPEFDDVQTEYVASRAEDLVLAWDRGTPSLALGVQTLGGTASLGCSFPGESGTGTISSELLAILDQGTELILLGVQTEVVMAGEYEVNVSSAGSVVTPDRTRRAKIVLE